MKFLFYCGLALLCAWGMFGHLRRGEDWLAAVCLVGTAAWLFNAGHELLEGK